MPRPTSEEIDELIVRTREAHEVLKDIKASTRELKDTIRQANEVQVQMMVAVAQAVDEGMADQISAGLAGYSSAIEEAIETATESVFKRFDLLAGILLGEDRDGDSIETVARVLRKSVDKNQTLTPIEEWKMEQAQEALARRLNDLGGPR